MADANIRAVITAKDEASKTISSFGKNAEGSFLKLGAVVGAVSGIMQTVTTRAISALSESLGTAINRVDTLNNATRTFQNMGFSVDDTSKAMKALNASILGLPTSLDKAVQNMELLASSTNDIGKSQKIFAANARGHVRIAVADWAGVRPLGLFLRRVLLRKADRFNFWRDLSQ
jgi:hypothetical protein